MDVTCRNQSNATTRVVLATDCFTRRRPTRSRATSRVARSRVARSRVAVLMNCSTQACMDVCDFACGFDDCPGGTGTLFIEAGDDYFAKEKGMVRRHAGLEP